MKAKILLVDDEADIELIIRQKFKKRIRSNELEFVFAYNGLEALKKLEADDSIDIVLSDLNMPIMDGLTMLEKIRLLYPEIITVIITAYSDMGKIRRAMNSGAFDFLNKPLDLDDLERTINKSVDEVINNREKDRLKRQLWMAQKMQAFGKLAGGLVHDINNLMMVILGHTQLLMYRDLDQEVIEGINEIKKTAEKTAALNKELLILSREKPLMAPQGAKTVLVLEEKPGEMSPAPEILDLFGYRVLTAGTDAARELLDKEREGIGLVVTATFPGKEAFDLIKETREMYPEINLLFISENSDNPVIREYLLGPAVLFLQKPYTNFELAGQVREILEPAVKKESSF